MKESIVKLPTHDNNGIPLDGLKESILKEVCKTFGGFSVYPCQGGWMNDEGKLYMESVNDIVIAMDDTEKNRKALLTIAETIKTKAEQEAVYIRYPDGTVKII